MVLLVVADLVDNKCNEAPAGYHRVCVDVAGGLVCRVISVSKPNSKMVEHIAFTYSSDPKFANRLWMCTHCDRMDIVQYFFLANRLQCCGAHKDIFGFVVNVSILLLSLCMEGI